MNNTGYAARSEHFYKDDGNYSARTVLMHRVIAERSFDSLDKPMIDHINGDKLDNTRLNLRSCNSSQNNGNAKVGINKSGFKGVYKTTNKSGKWMAIITHESTRKYLGSFSDKLDAAKAYNQAASEFFGEFARLNKVKEI